MVINRSRWIFVKKCLNWGKGYLIDLGGQIHITYCNKYTNHLRVIMVFDSLRYGQTNQNGILFSYRGKIDFENLHALEKTAGKLSTRTKYVLFYLLSI